MKELAMAHHKIPHGHFRFVFRLDNIAIFSNRGETHGKCLANCSDFLYRYLDFFGDLLIGDVWISGGVFANFEIEIGVRARYLNQSGIIPKIVQHMKLQASIHPGRKVGTFTLIPRVVDFYNVLKGSIPQLFIGQPCKR